MEARSVDGRRKVRHSIGMESKENVEKTYTDPETGKFVKGNPGGGRPKGSFSLMTRIKQYLEAHPDKVDELRDYYINDESMRSLLLQMIDGRPQQDVTSGGEKLPTPLLHVFNNDSHKEDTQPEAES